MLPRGGESLGERIASCSGQGRKGLGNRQPVGIDLEPVATEVGDERSNGNSGAGAHQPQHSVVRDHHDRPQSRFVDQITQSLVETGENFRVGFATRWTVEVTLTPCRPLSRPAFVDLGSGKTLPVTTVSFSEAGVGPRFDGTDCGREDLSSARGPSEIGTHDHYAFGSDLQTLRPMTGLAFSMGSEGGIGPPLPAAFSVPGGLTVTNQQHSLHGGSEPDPPGNWRVTIDGLTPKPRTPRIDCSG